MKPGIQLGPYEIVELLGAGGMGEVYRARDTRLGRTVAIKILSPEYSQNDDLRARFEREARAISSISDPHICTLYDIGEVERGEGGETTAYLVMEYLEGESLADLIARGALPVDESLRYGAEIASALSSAHRHGIVHRDLKPGNVMITPSGAKLLDFGLAKTASDHPLDAGDSSAETMKKPITRIGQVLGTPQYMAPEQVEGLPADSRTDIFALGVILYEMATGRRAFVGRSPASLASSILRDEPEPMSQLGAGIPRAFEHIVRRCLMKDPEERWQSAKDIAAELNEIRVELVAVHSHEDVSGSENGVGFRVPRPLAVAAISVVVIGVLLVIAWLSWSSRTPESVAATHVEVEQLTTRPGIEWFPSLSPDGKWVVYAAMVDRHRHIFLQSVGGRKPVDLTEDSPGDDDQPAFSPDGEQIAFRSSREGGGIFVMGKTGEAVRRLTRAGFKPTWSPDGKQIAYAIENVELNPQNAVSRSELWSVSVAGGEPKRIYEGDAVLASWSPHGHRIAFTQRAGNPFQGDIYTIPAAGGTPEAVTDDRWTDWNPVWSPDGSYLYFASDRGGSMNLWRVVVDERSGKVKSEPEPVTVPAPTFAHPSLSADGRHIVYTSVLVTSNIQRLEFDLATAELRGDPAWLTTGSRRWSSPDPSPDGEWVVFYSLTRPEGHLYVARPDGTGLRQITGDEAIDRVPRWSPDGEWIAFFSTRAAPLELWKVRPDGSDLQQITQGGGTYLAWSPDSTQIATVRGVAGDTTSVALFDPSRPWSEQEVEELPPMDEQSTPFLVNSWSPDGKRLVGSVGLKAQGIATYDLETGTYERLVDFGEWPVWMPDGKRILFVSGGNGFYVLDTLTKEVRKVYSVTSDVIGPPRYSADGAVYYSRRVTEADVWMATLK